MMLTIDIAEDIKARLKQKGDEVNMSLPDYILSILMNEAGSQSPSTPSYINREYDDGFRCWLSDEYDGPFDDFRDSI